MFSTYVTTMFISSHFNTLFSSVLRIHNINWRQRRRKILLLEMETCFCLLHAFASFDQTNYFHECTLPSFGFVFICASMCIHSILNTLIVLKLMSFPLSKCVRVLRHGKSRWHTLNCFTTASAMRSARLRFFDAQKIRMHRFKLNSLKWEYQVKCFWNKGIVPISRSKFDLDISHHRFH